MQGHAREGRVPERESVSWVSHISLSICTRILGSHELQECGLPLFRRRGILESGPVSRALLKTVGGLQRRQVEGSGTVNMTEVAEAKVRCAEWIVANE